MFIILFIIFLSVQQSNDKKIDSPYFMDNLNNLDNANQITYTKFLKVKVLWSEWE